MDHEKHIVRMFLLQGHPPVGEFSIFVGEEWHPESGAISERLAARCCIAANNFGWNAFHKNHAPELFETFVHISSPF